MNDILELFVEDEVVESFEKGIEVNNFSYLVNNLSVNHGYLLTSLAFKKTNKFIIYLASNLYKANHSYDMFCNLVGYENVNLYVVDELVSSELIAVSSDLKNERLDTFKSIFDNTPKIIITHPQALLRPLINKEDYFGSIINIKVNDDLNVDEFINNLIKLGYKKRPTTELPGEFSVRGEIIDVFSNYYDEPIRINLFDIEVETIKTFDPQTQRSNKKIDSAIIFPINELIYDENKKNEVIKKIRSVSAEIPNFVQRDLLDFENYENLERITKYIKYIDSNPATLLDYIEDKIVFYNEFSQLKDNYNNLILDLDNYIGTLNKPAKLDLFFFFDFYNILHNVNNKVFTSFAKQSLNNIKLDKIYSLGGYGVIDYQNDIKNLIADLKANKNKTFVFAFREEERLNLLREILADGGLEVNFITSYKQIKKKSINLIKVVNPISYGFIHSNFEVLTEREIFKSIKIPKAKFRTSMQTKPVSSKDELQRGDYVVHYDYGIAIYLGIKTVELKDIKNDYILLKFENIELYIPVEKINLIEKYQGTEGTVPKLTNIGKGEWDKKKKRIKEKLETIAADLIKIQASREQNRGVKYPKDNDYQKLFEDDFIYEETKDQIKAIEEIKKDMEDGKIIDRLICGDVGYGKTEIAMRIAFKTVFENKQVAYLAPTTILTRQHYYTFKERFEKYGIKVELINRLVSRKKQAEIIDNLRNGTVDIVIGTHRLLSEDIVFKDLGLLVVDEEQRFGVVHKEKIKKLKENVNVLTLTATPIPRTLQMSIMGVRQMSLIETPPKDRYPIQTYVLEENDAIIKEAIYRELARDGQVFYLHNRIDGLDRLQRKIQRLVPEARIITAHGKMTKNELENSIQAFIDKDYNVLLCTTIIETGIDIPNTNTLIIDRADYLGLSQIYQIRGRVGRSDRIAYAYLLYEEDKVITEDATKRLNAIKEFTNLGSGYKIAVRDLAIRGAGDILGKEQSGFVDAIGLDMYMKMLNEAIKKVQGIPEEKEEENYRIEISKHVDESYVSDDDIKILIHKEIHKIKSKEDKEEIITEFSDRFGKLNEEILLYIEERYLQKLLKKFKIHNVMESNNLVMAIFNKKTSKEVNAEKLFVNATNISNRIDFEYKNEQIIIKIKKEPKDKTWIYVLSNLLDSLL
ncbi:MAG: transcription-repair coupling factor [Bacilli bacterium]|nr:transcription-repair coupling factor [Bacilli bacterium]